MKTNKFIIIGVIVGIIILAGSFYGGLKYGQSKNSFRGNNFQNIANIQKGSPNGNSQNGMANGEIVSKDDKSITVKLSNGGSKIIFLSENTKVSKMTDGSLEDLDIGSSIIVVGISDQDGSIVAQSIQLRSDLPMDQPIPGQLDEKSGEMPPNN